MKAEKSKGLGWRSTRDSDSIFIGCIFIIQRGHVGTMDNSSADLSAYVRANVLRIVH